VSDLAPIASLVNVQTLNFWGIQVSLLAPIQVLTSIQELDFSNTRVSDLAYCATIWMRKSDNQGENL